MLKKHANVAILILLVAACAFVMDVLSPATPTPTAQFVAKCFVIGLVLSIVLTSIVWSPEGAPQRQSFPAESRPAKRDPRALLTLICILLF
jgi:hypothetical protein